MNDLITASTGQSAHQDLAKKILPMAHFL